MWWLIMANEIRLQAFMANCGVASRRKCEEIITAGRVKVNGVVVATKPLSLHGILVENFKVYFKDGKAYKVEAEKGLEVLEKTLDMDESSRYLGEVALVPFDSPINKSKVLFYNTLFDENAACHLAFGEGVEGVAGLFHVLPGLQVHQDISRGGGVVLNLCDFQLTFLHGILDALDDRFRGGAVGDFADGERLVVDLFNLCAHADLVAGVQLVQGSGHFARAHHGELKVILARGLRVDNEGGFAHAEHGKLAHLTGLVGEVVPGFLVIETHTERLDGRGFRDDFQNGGDFRQIRVLAAAAVMFAHTASLLLLGLALGGRLLGSGLLGGSSNLLHNHFPFSMR